jgi:hypothetical protein
MANTIIDGLSTSRGIFLDDQNNVFVSDWNLDFTKFNNYIKKFDQNAALVDSVLISNDAVGAKFSSLPNSNSFIGLREDGLVILFDPDSLSIDLLIDLRSLQGVETSPVYDTTLEALNPIPLVLLSGSNFNDIAVRENGGVLELFITGQYASNIFPFVMRVQVSSDLTNLIQAQVLMVGQYGQPWGPLPPGVVPLPPPNGITGPGIAVNANGTVLTALPTPEGDPYFAHPDLIAFPADFEPTDVLDSNQNNDPFVVSSGVGIESFGMTTDAAGNFYVLDYDPGLSQATSVVILPPTLGTPSSIEVLGGAALANPGASRGDIAIDSMNQKAYVTFNTTVMVFDIDVVLPLPPDKYDDYLASNPDLIAAFGYNLEAARMHYEQFGANEGRPIDIFDEALYLASNPDLIPVFGYNLDASTRHYIEYGYWESRQKNFFLPQRYLDVYPDLKAVFGNDTNAAIRHYVEYGYWEGRDFLLGFEPGAYVASYPDLVTAFSYNLEAGRQHYVNYGYYEGRTITFEPDDYLASHGDLIQAFGYDLAAATWHYITFGATENRVKDNFNEVAYLNKYPDLQNAFGSDLAAATWHFIQYGYFEGRSDIV